MTTHPHIHAQAEKTVEIKKRYCKGRQKGQRRNKGNDNFHQKPHEEESSG